MIVDEKELYSVNHKASISRRVSVFSFNFIDYLLIDLLSSTIEKIAHGVALEAAARKVFEIKTFADTLLFLIHQKLIKSTYPTNSLERQPVILELTASDDLCRL